MNASAVTHCVTRALDAGSFFVAPGYTLHVEYLPGEETRWELFQGQLLDAALTRRTERFDSWRVVLIGPTAEDRAPLIVVRHQLEQQVMHVTRQVLVYGHEAYEAAPGVILSRPVQKWHAELVGTLPLDSAEPSRLQRELGETLRLATVGTSRLPITSLESPLPAFSLGHFAYLPGALVAAGPISDASQFFTAALSGDRPAVERCLALEVALRASRPASLGTLAALLVAESAREPQGPMWLSELIRGLFHGAALSPPTGFAESLVALVVELASHATLGDGWSLDELTFMLRQLGRHLTAFDLERFHNLGANYPDALFLETLLTALRTLHERSPKLLTESSTAGRLRRRALRQGLLLRAHYEGHRVPDVPTSQGEHARVLPPGFARVPEEQIREPGKRRRTLFADVSTSAVAASFGPALAAALDDLAEPAELRELGMALFLDRPLGLAKPAGMSDRTPLVACEAFSAAVAQRRLAILQAAGWIDGSRTARIKSLAVEGLPVSEVQVRARPGVVSLLDAAKAAGDFVLIRSLPSSLAALRDRFDWSSLEKQFPATHAWLLAGQNVLLVPREEPVSGEMKLQFYEAGRLRLVLGLAAHSGGRLEYGQRLGVELVRQLRVLAVDGQILGQAAVLSVPALSD